jgi:hypothetical protein
MGPLTDDHHCPRGRFSDVGRLAAVVAAGAAASTTICYAVIDRPAGLVVMSIAALGGVLAYGVRQAVGPRW